MIRVITTCLLLAVFSLLTVVPGGCASGGGASAPSIQNLVGEWAVKTLGGKDISSLLPAGSKVPTLDFKPDGSVSGFAGVNRLSSKLNLAELAKGQFSLSPAAMTMMAGPPESMKVEQMFTEALNQARGLKLDGNTLSLTKDGSSLMSLVRK